MARFGALQTLSTALRALSSSSIQSPGVSRPIFTEVVTRDKANLAMRKIQDSIRFEGLDKEWRAKQRRVRPCIKRKMEAKESRKKIIQAQFREQIQAILSRKSRGF